MRRYQRASTRASRASGDLMRPQRGVNHSADIRPQGVARGKGPRRRTVTPQGADSAPGQDAKLRLCEAFRRATRRLRLPLRGGLQMIAQVRAALFHLVAQLAAAEGGERGIAELPPGGVEPLLQSADILVQEFGLGACAT